MGDQFFASQSKPCYRFVVGALRGLALQRNGAIKETAPYCPRAHLKRLTRRRRAAPWERFGIKMGILRTLC